MAQANNTPVSYWVALPLTALIQWIRASNRIVNKRKPQRGCAAEKKPRAPAAVLRRK